MATIQTNKSNDKSITNNLDEEFNKEFGRWLLSLYDATPFPRKRRCKVSKKIKAKIAPNKLRRSKRLIGKAKRAILAERQKAFKLKELKKTHVRILPAPNIPIADLFDLVEAINISGRVGNMKKKTYFYTTFALEQPKLVSARRAKLYLPHLVINYYEKLLSRENPNVAFPSKHN